MPVDPSKTFVIGISSRSLFDLSYENKLFEEQGVRAYADYQIDHENEILPRGTGFYLVQAILRLNEQLKDGRKTDVVMMSKNSADTGLRIWNSIEHYGLHIIRGSFTSGAPLQPYLNAYSVDLFLSANEDDVRVALRSGIAAGLIYAPPTSAEFAKEELRVAFDGDSVLFSDEAERVYKEKKLDGFLEHEKRNARRALPDGPLAKVLRALYRLQIQGEKEGKKLLRTALITARNSPAHERVIRTLREWKVSIDEVHFLGGIPKDKLVQAFAPHIFFDDQDVHCAPASLVAPTARIPTEEVPQKPVQRELQIEVHGAAAVAENATCVPHPAG